MVKIIRKEINEDTNSSVSEHNAIVPEKTYAKITKHKKASIIALAIVLVALGLFFAKGFFIAATVNGSPVSRFSVVKELEKRSGKQALQSLIQKKLIETELDKKGITVTQEEIGSEIKKIEAQIASQGITLKDALAGQGITEDDLREQIATQKKLEKLLAEKIAVLETEIDAYIEDSKVTPLEGVKTENFRKQISEQLKQQKFQEEAQRWVSALTASAKINYYINY